MSDHSPHAPLPPAAQSPYPAHPAPHAHLAPALPVRPAETAVAHAEPATPPRSAGTLRTVALIGGGIVAAGLGLALLLPRLRPQPPVKRKSGKRGKGGKRK